MLIRANLHESKLKWGGEDSFQSSEHRYFYEEFEKAFDAAIADVDSKDYSKSKQQRVTGGSKGMTDEEQFAEVKKQISSSVAQFKSEMELIIAGNSSSDDED